MIWQKHVAMSDSWRLMLSSRHSILRHLALVLARYKVPSYPPQSIVIVRRWPPEVWSQGCFQQLQTLKCQTQQASRSGGSLAADASNNDRWPLTTHPTHLEPVSHGFCWFKFDSAHFDDTLMNQVHILYFCGGCRMQSRRSFSWGQLSQHLNLLELSQNFEPHSTNGAPFSHSSPHLSKNGEKAKEKNTHNQKIIENRNHILHSNDFPPKSSGKPITKPSQAPWIFPSHVHLSHPHPPALRIPGATPLDLRPAGPAVARLLGSPAATATAPRPPRGPSPSTARSALPGIFMDGWMVLDDFFWGSIIYL